jgi:hypothetical protein
MTTLVTLLLAAVVRAPPTAAKVEATQKQFQDLETRLVDAVQIKNTQALEALVSPNFAFSLMIEGREPEVLNRSEWLKMNTAQARLEGFETPPGGGKVLRGPRARPRSGGADGR